MMTHRGRQNKKDRVLRYLDLSFEGRHQNQKNGNVPTSAARVQGGPKSGRRPTPQPRVAARKPVDYTAQLEADIQRLLEGENAENTASKGRAANVPCEPPSTPESTFSPDDSLAQSKFENQNGYQYNRVAASAKQPKPTVSPDGPLHRQNHVHRYLMATEKRPKTAGYDGEHRLGRPTRTTLLRARQRCNSAPVSSFESRKDMQKRVVQRAEMQKQITSQFSQSMADLLPLRVPQGESLRGFLIGARYNSVTWIRDLSLDDSPRAHHLDDKGLKEYGVYVPRHTNGAPPNCFMIKRMKLKQRDQEQQEQDSPPPQAPAASRTRVDRPATAAAAGPRHRQVTSPPPSSPAASPRLKYPPTPSVSARSADHQPQSSRSAENHPSLMVTPQLGSRSAAAYSHQHTRHAWSDKARFEINGRLSQEVDTSRERHIPPVSVEVINTNDGITIQGVGFVGSTPKVARSLSARSRQSINRPSSRSGHDSDVMIQGKSMHSFNNGPTIVADNSSSGGRVMSARIPRPKTAVHRHILSARDVSQQLMTENNDKSEGDSMVGSHQGRDSSPEEASLEMPILDTAEVMSVGSEEDSSHRMSAPSPSPVSSPRQIPPDSPQEDEGSPQEEIFNSPRTDEVTMSTGPVVDSVEMSESVQSEHSPAELNGEDGTHNADEKPEKLTPIIHKANRAQSARGKKSRVRFADEIPDDNCGTVKAEDEDSNQDPVFLTEEKESADEEQTVLGEGPGMEGESEPIQASPSSTTLMEDAGDMVEGSASNGHPENLSEDHSYKDGSGDFHPEGEGTEKSMEESSLETNFKGNSVKMNGLLNVPLEDNDDGSVLSDEQHIPREVISVDITPKSNLENKPT